MADTYTYTQVRRVTPKGGPSVGGTAVTISGFGFDFATGGVTFGGVAATSIAIVSNTTITAVTPAHATGAVDVVVAGVGTGSALYTYDVNAIKLPPVPVTAAVVQGGAGGAGSAQAKMQLDYQKWLMAAKQAIEEFPFATWAASSIVGTFSVDQIPELPWDKIDKADSSLADLTTRSATDLTSGVLRQAYGGTGRPFAYSYAPGSFTVPDGTFAVILSQLQLTGSLDTLTVLGTGSVGIL